MSKGTILQYNGSGIGTPSGAYAIENLTPENIKNGVNIGGVVGSFNGSNNAIFEQITLNADLYSLTIDNIQNVTKIMVFQSTMGSKSISVAQYGITDLEVTKFSDGWFGYYHRWVSSWGCNPTTPTQTQYIKTSENNGALTLQSQSSVTGGKWLAGTYDIVKIYE